LISNLSTMAAFPIDTLTARQAVEARLRGPMWSSAGRAWAHIRPTVAREAHVIGVIACIWLLVPVDRRWATNNKRLAVYSSSRAEIIAGTSVRLV
jgi:hypothetical protein